jgi:hypothetical protein
VTLTLDKGRRLARRRMAWVSFSLMVVIALALFGALLISPERAAIATALNMVSTLLGTIMSLFTLIILGYLGISGAESILTKRKED